MIKSNVCLHINVLKNTTESNTENFWTHINKVCLISNCVSNI